MIHERSMGLAGTFTVEPIEDGLRFWWAQLGVEIPVRFAPYHQVFQQLLDPAGVLARSELNVLLIRWEDWARDLRDRAALERSAAELADGLNAISRPTLVILCHPSPGAIAALGEGFLAALDASLSAAVSQAGSVTVVDPTGLDRHYRVAQPHDPYGAENGAVPYVAEYYTALASRIARQVALWQWPAPKVIVLDADDTLWRGACAEVGPDGVEPALELQRFIASRADSGTLLACAAGTSRPMCTRCSRGTPGCR